MISQTHSYKHGVVFHTYLATKNEDSVDVGKDAMKAEVNVRTYQRKN